MRLRGHEMAAILTIAAVLIVLRVVLRGWP